MVKFTYIYCVSLNIRWKILNNRKQYVSLFWILLFPRRNFGSTTLRIFISHGVISQSLSGILVFLRVFSKEWLKVVPLVCMYMQVTLENKWFCHTRLSIGIQEPVDLRRSLWTRAKKDHSKLEVMLTKILVFCHLGGPNWYFCYSYSLRHVVRCAWG